MLKLQSFDDFSKMKAEQVQAENLATLTKLREESANTFKSLLSEYGVSKVSDLSEEQRLEFFSKIQESKDMGSFVFESALSITGKRDAKKVLTQYNQILNSKFNAIGQGGDKKSILGAVKYLFWNAMEDANFSREANVIMNNIKGGINTVMVSVEGLGGLMASVGATQIKKALDAEYHRISNAAGWSGIGIVEGTALYLEQLGEATTAAKLLADFNAQFESKEVMESRIAEGNAFGAARAKAIADGKDEFEVDGETYKVKSVDKEDKENAKEFSGESVTIKESKEAAEAESILNDLLDERGGDMEELHGMSMEDALDTVEAYGHSGSKAKKIAHELFSLCNESAVTEAEKIEVGTFVRYKKDKDFTGGKILSIKGSNVEIHNWDGSTTELPLKDLEYVKSWNESVVTEAKFDKKKLMKAVTGDDGIISTGDGKEYIIYKYGNGNDDNDAMWNDKSIIALDQDGEEYEIEYSDIVRYDESKVNEAEIKSDDEFKEYAMTVLKKAFGADFDEAKAQEVVDGILSKSDGDYGKAAGILQSSLG